MPNRKFDNVGVFPAVTIEHVYTKPTAGIEVFGEVNDSGSGVTEFVALPVSETELQQIIDVVGQQVVEIENID